jgi:ATP-dependent DNA ligase
LQAIWGSEDLFWARVISSFDLVRHHRANERIFLYAFDVIELNRDDLWRDPLEGRKATLE